MCVCLFIVYSSFFVCVIVIQDGETFKADNENTIRLLINETAFAGSQAQLPFIPENLQFQVERDNIVQSAIENVEKYWDDSDSNSVWLKPLKVNFDGEYAIDVGGPSKVNIK